MDFPSIWNVVSEEAQSKPDVMGTTEFPTVVLGEAGETLVPRRRLLYGRVPESYVLYPIYLSVTIAGAFASKFALNTEEWHIAPVGLAWGSLFVWYWFYGVAYRYRRRLLKYTSVLVIFGLTSSLAFFCEDRAARQIVAVGGELVERAPVLDLYWAAHITWLGIVALAVHVVFLGRGYREKKE